MKGTSTKMYLYVLVYSKTNLFIIIGVVIKTHKPIPLQEIEMTGGGKPPDRNTEMKFAFLSTETTPDYRSLDVRFL